MRFVMRLKSSIYWRVCLDALSLVVFKCQVWIQLLFLIATKWPFSSVYRFLRLPQISNPTCLIINLISLEVESFLKHLPHLVFIVAFSFNFFHQSAISSFVFMCAFGIALWSLSCLNRGRLLYWPPFSIFLVGLEHPFSPCFCHQFVISEEVTGLPLFLLSGGHHRFSQKFALRCEPLKIYVLKWIKLQGFCGRLHLAFAIHGSYLLWRVIVVIRPALYIFYNSIYHEGVHLERLYPVKMQVGICLFVLFNLLLFLYHERALTKSVLQASIQEIVSSNAFITLNAFKICSRQGIFEYTCLSVRSLRTIR